MGGKVGLVQRNREARTYLDKVNRVNRTYVPVVVQYLKFREEIDIDWK